MNAATEATETFAAPASPVPPTRPFYWSVRRELWEHRSLYIAPLVAGGVIILGFLVAMLSNAQHFSAGMQSFGDMSSSQLRQILSGLYGVIALMIAIASTVTAMFYLLDALQGERRDRSVLFWKSLPVSDTTAVLTKLFTAMAVAPAIAFAVIIATQLVVIVLSSIGLLLAGANPAPLWTNLPIFFQVTVVVIYSLIVISLWFAPIYGWLLLVSSWAKRSTFLWAVIPPVAVIVFERLAFGTRYFANMLSYRLGDGMESAFVNGERGRRGDVGAEFAAKAEAHDLLATLDPGGFLANPYLWVGLAVAAGFVAAAIWMRRYREPI
jgi:ABC-2 type transport system permease protein